MQSLTISLFSGAISRGVHVSLPIVDQVSMIERIQQLMNRKEGRSPFPEEGMQVSCRELFQNNDSEIFFFPTIRGKIVTLKILTVGSLCLFKTGYKDWGFVFCFTPSKTCKNVFPSTKASKFQQKDGYPEGVDHADFFYFSPTWLSVLVSPHGFIRMNDEGTYILHGIEAALLQRPSYKEKVFFLQRKNIVVSPINPLKEGESGSAVQSAFKFVKISCFCRHNNFCYSTKFPVLTEDELEKKLQKNSSDRLLKYGFASLKYSCSAVMQSLPESNPGQSHLIVFPRGMGINVPFGSCLGGEIFFVYCGHSLGAFKMVFLPRLFDKNKRILQPIYRRWDSWHVKDSRPLVSLPNVKAANIYSIPLGGLVQCSALEFKLVGIKMEMVTTSQIGSWGVFVSPETATALSVSNPHTQEERRSSPLPGTSGLRSRRTTTQAAATVSVPPERQGQQTQQRRKNLIPGPFGVRHHPYPQYEPWSFSEEFYPYFYPGTGSFVGGLYPYGSSLPPCPHPSARQGQWVPDFPPSASAVRPSVAALEPLRYNIPVQKEGIGHSERAETTASVLVGTVQQTSIWRPNEEHSNTAISSQAQAEKPSEDTDIDVENLS